MFRSILSLLVAAFLLLSPVADAQFSKKNPLKLKTPFGTILGRYETTEQGIVRAFYGVPFALPPVGQKRFTYPEPSGSTWDGGFINGSTPSSLCYFAYAGNAPPFVGSEDCLYLDIWLPENSTTTENLPVLAQVPGGGYTGLGYLPAIDMVAASQSMITVWIHYRVNVFGFMATAGLSRETSPYPSSGNYGIADIMTGMKWVHDHISAFGGNSKKITLQALSAGAWSMSIVQTSPKTKGLYQQLILDSGGSDQSVTLSNQQEKELAGQGLASLAGCPWDSSKDPNYKLQSACLRNVSDSTLLTAFNEASLYAFWDDQVLYPTVDGWWVTDWPQTLFAKGAFHDVPILAGSTLEEMNLIQFVPFFENVTHPWSYQNATYADVATWTEKVGGKLGVNAQAATNLSDYYLNPNQTFSVRVPRNLSDAVGTNQGPYAALVEISSGIIFQCPVRRSLQYQAGKNQPSYGYAYGYRESEAAAGGTVAAYADHGSQSFLVYYPSNYTFADPIDKMMSQNMQQYWISFISNGDPNNHKGLNFSFGVNKTLPSWPSQTKGNDTVLLLGNHDRLQDNIIEVKEGVYKYCDLLDAVIPHYTYRPNCAPGYTLGSDYKTCNNVTSG